MQKTHKKQFHILSLRDEKKLSPEELVQYYADLRTYALQRKLTNTTPGALTIAPHLKGVTDKIVKMFLKLAQLNTGLILVSKKDEDVENRQNARLDMLQILLRGHSIAYFPESAWNLSPNRLHLPMSYGFLDMARKADVPVVPVAMEFTYNTSTDRERITKVHIRYGQAIMVNASDSLAEKLEEYSEAVSTMRWELIEEKGCFSRKDVSGRDYSNYLKGNLRNLQMGGSLPVR